MSGAFWKGRRVAVTGAAGFIGSHLVEELARQGARVRALVRYNSLSNWGFLEGLEPARMTGWKPRWTLEKGLAATLSYVESHLADYKAGRYNV